MIGKYQGLLGEKGLSRVALDKSCVSFGFLFFLETNQVKIDHSFNCVASSEFFC